MKKFILDSIGWTILFIAVGFGRNPDNQWYSMEWYNITILCILLVTAIILLKFSTHFDE
jgi:hypothetical protein